MKRNKGITLIALVITIVILIILALISINAIIGEDGIISRTNDARLVSEQGTVLEDLRLEIYDKISNLENSGLKGLEYLQTKTDGKVRADNTVDVTKVREGIKSGRGSLEAGDVYYIEGTELFYLDKEKNPKNLGQIFNDVESLNPNLEINKEVTSTPANGERYAVGEVVKYKITVKNIGTKTISDIKVEDKLTAVDIVTKEETVRLNQTFETLYDASGNEIGDTLEPGKTGYITYSYTVVSDDMGKDLRNKATVKGKNAIPKGEKDVITPVELQDGYFALRKVIGEPRENAKGIIDPDSKNRKFEFKLYIYENGKRLEKVPENIVVYTPDGTGGSLNSDGDSIEGLYLRDGESLILTGLGEGQSAEIMEYITCVSFSEEDPGNRLLVFPRNGS